MRRFGSLNRSTPSFTEDDTPAPSSPSTSKPKIQVQHEEVDIEDDLDIPTFLRNKY